MKVFSPGSVHSAGASGTGLRASSTQSLSTGSYAFTNLADTAWAGSKLLTSVQVELRNSVPACEHLKDLQQQKDAALQCSSRLSRAVRTGGTKGQPHLQLLGSAN